MLMSEGLCKVFYFGCHVFFTTDVISSNLLSYPHLQVLGKYLDDYQEHCCEICYGSSMSPEGEPFDEPNIAHVLVADRQLYI